jgi:hypothetical protein
MKAFTPQKSHLPRREIIKKIRITLRYEWRIANLLQFDHISGRIVRGDRNTQQ